jgi:hypothetical protein
MDGAQILNEKVGVANRIKDNNKNSVRKSFVADGVSYSLSPEELKDDWLLPIRLYKGSSGNAAALARDWNNLIYKKWPYPKSPYNMYSNLLGQLWDKRDTFLIK